MALAFLLAISVPLPRAADAAFPSTEVITVTNRASATVGAYEQLLNVSLATVAGVTTNLSNVEFSYENGTPIPSWLARLTATYALVWVRMDGLGASASVPIVATFGATSVLSAAGPAGESPLLSGTYAQFDDGASVFPYYTNFSGTSAPAGWTVYHGSVSNGVTVTSGWQLGGAVGSYALAADDVLEGTFETTGVSDYAAIGTSTGPTTPPSGAWALEARYPDSGGGGKFDFEPSPNGATTVVAYPNVVWVIGAELNSTGMAQLNYTTVPTSPTQPYSVSASVPALGAIGSATFYVVDVRTGPPAGIMPSVTFGPIVGPPHPYVFPVLTNDPTATAYALIGVALLGVSAGIVLLYVFYVPNRRHGGPTERL